MKERNVERDYKIQKFDRLPDLLFKSGVHLDQVFLTFFAAWTPQKNFHGPPKCR